MHRKHLLPVLIALPLLIVAGCGDDSEDPPAANNTAANNTSANNTGENNADPEAEALKVYSDTCAVCHGGDGEGSALGYELRHPTRPYFTWMVRNGRIGDLGVMSAYGEATVTDAQLEIIYDFLDAFPKGTTGQELYSDFCATCHGDNGAGGPTGKSLVGEPAAEIMSTVRSGKGGDDYGNRTMYMPAYDTTALTDAELALIVEFVGTL